MAGIGLGIGVGLGIGGRSAFKKEASDYFKRMTTQPSSDFKKRVNNFIASQIANGFWDRTNVYVMLQAETAQAAVLNMKGDFNNGQFVNSPTWAANDGMTADVGYCDTNFNPSTQGAGIYTQNNARMILYTKTENGVKAFNDMGSFNGVNVITIASRFTGDLLRGSLNNIVGSIATISSNNAIGVNSVNRTSSTRLVMAKNGVSGTASSIASVEPNDLNIYLGGINNNGTPTTLTGRKYGFYAIGGGFSDAETLESYNNLKPLLQIL
jgi:hypothetical protein